MFSIRLADHDFVIHNRYELIHHQSGKYCIPENSGVDISVTDEEILREKRGDRPVDYLESVAICRKIADYLIEKDTLLFHGSAVAVDGEAYIFTASSGYGKSTHARLWRELFGQRAVMINDDKPFIKIGDSGHVVYGSPWDGKHSLSSNISAPLKAVCILYRDPENHIRPIPKELALAMLVRQTHRPQDPVLLKKTLQLIEKLSRNVNFYRLMCNMDPEAARVAYNGMLEEGNTPF